MIMFKYEFSNRKKYVHLSILVCILIIKYSCHFLTSVFIRIYIVFSCNLCMCIAWFEVKIFVTTFPPSARNMCRNFLFGFPIHIIVTQYGKYFLYYHEIFLLLQATLSTFSYHSHIYGRDRNKKTIYQFNNTNNRLNFIYELDERVRIGLKYEVPI